MSDQKRVFLYKISGKIFFRANSQTEQGMYMEYGPYSIVDESLVMSKLGQHILSTFEQCKTDIPHPEDLTKLSVLEKADPYSTSEEAKLLKKLKKTLKDSRLAVLFDGTTYTFHPYRVINKQYSEGIKGVSLSSDGNPENLGKTLLQAFELCE